MTCPQAKNQPTSLSGPPVAHYSRVNRPACGLESLLMVIMMMMIINIIMMMTMMMMMMMIMVMTMMVMMMPPIAHNSRVNWSARGLKGLYICI
jgi:hypothetical protein